MKKIISIILILAALGMLGVFGWQYRQSVLEKRVSGEQAALRPEELTEDAGGLPIMDFSEIQEQYPDIIGWLSIGSIDVDYPVVCGTDNSYYLTHTAEKKANRMGAIFLEYKNSRDMSDFYSVIYGHNMQSGLMFGKLERFKEREFFDENTTGRLYLPGKTYELEIFAVSVTPSVSGYYQYIFRSPAEKEAHIEMIKDSALYYRDIGPGAGDRLIALSTCSYEYQDARTLVIARLK